MQSREIKNVKHSLLRNEKFNKSMGVTSAGKQKLLVVGTLLTLITLPAQAAPFIDCADNILRNAAACNRPEVRDELLDLDKVYTLLMKSHDRRLAFLAGQDRESFGITLRNCGNLFSSTDGGKGINACIEQEIAATSVLSAKSTVETLLDLLRQNKFLHLSLMKGFSQPMLDVSTRWFGSLGFKKFNSSQLLGRLFDGDQSFAAIINDPNENDRTFFSSGSCRYSCASWWAGKFVSVDGTLTFIVQDHQQ
jgi:hypothetical protein